MSTTIHDVARMINDVLSSHGLPPVADARGLAPGNNALMESGSTPISDAIFEAYVPSVQQPATLLHFTSFPVFEAILTSGRLRLTSPLRRYQEHEYRDFYERHGLDGYAQAGADGQPLYKTMMRDLFYISLTIPSERGNPTLWRDFAMKGTGVCLRLEAETLRPEAQLRKLAYAPGTTPQVPALVSLNDELGRSFSLTFVPDQVSRLGAFCLPSRYAHEKERRLLVKRFNGDGLVSKGPSDEPWVEVPLRGGNRHLELTLVGVTPGPRASYWKVWNTLRKAGYGWWVAMTLLERRARP